MEQGKLMKPNKPSKIEIVNPSQLYHDDIYFKSGPSFRKLFSHLETKFQHQDEFTIEPIYFNHRNVSEASISGNKFGYNVAQPIVNRIFGVRLCFLKKSKQI
jgi:hypothetical protein